MKSERLVSLDAFRGMTVAGMLLVNDPGTWSAIYPPLEHASWHGWTPTDLVFPFFLFIVGITTEISLQSRRARGDDEGALLRQVFKRGALIFLFGLLLNGFPFFSWSQDMAGAGVLARVADRIEHWRIMGVLQRIGLAYVCSALITMHTGWRKQVTVLIGLLLGYWAIMTLVPVPGTGVPGYMVLDKPDQLISAWLDRTVFGLNHLWSGSRTWDPEGLLSTVPAVGTVICGSLAGRWLARRDLPLTERLAALLAVGAIAMMLGLMWNWTFPINKGIWSSSYVVFTAGMAAVTLGTCMWLIDVVGWRRWTMPFVVYGTNPMLAFLGSGVMARTTASLWKVTTPTGATISVQEFVFQTAYASWLPLKLASLMYAVSFVAFWFVILWAAWKRGFILKV